MGGVPFIVKAGKALNEHKCEIRVQLKDARDPFASSRVNGRQARNEFVVRLQPDPAIYMKMTVKEPGLGMELAQSELELLRESTRTSASRRRTTTIPDPQRRPATLRAQGRARRRGRHSPRSEVHRRGG